MNDIKEFLPISIISLLAFLFLLTYSHTANAQQTLYSCQNPGGEVPLLHTIDPATGATLTTTEITLGDTEINGCNGMAKDPTTGVCWIILSPPGSAGRDGDTGPRILATLDEKTGVATEIGDTGEVIAAIAFDLEGTLYALTGGQQNAVNPQNPSTLFILDKSDATPTFFQMLGNGSGGETLAFNPLNGLLYHASGNPPALNVNVIFETINPENMIISPITISGDTGQYDEQTALVHKSGNVFLTAQRTPNAFHSITTSGEVTFLGDMDHRSKGLAFDCGFPDPRLVGIPTLSEWGLIVTVIALGIVGLFALRRRSAIN